MRDFTQFSAKMTLISFSFLTEHCTTVHNMRFKTKSGVTISNNTVQKRLQEEAMKRSKEMAEEQQQQQQQQQLLQQQQQVPKSQQPLEDGSVIGKFVKPKPPPPLKKPTAEIHPAFYYQENPYSQDNQAYFTQETNFSQEIHAENLGEIHAVQEMQVFENSMEELPKIKNIFSTSSRKEKPLNITSPACYDCTVFTV